MTPAPLILQCQGNKDAGRDPPTGLAGGAEMSNGSCCTPGLGARAEQSSLFAFSYLCRITRRPRASITGSVGRAQIGSACRQLLFLIVALLQLLLSVRAKRRMGSWAQSDAITSVESSWQLLKEALLAGWCCSVSLWKTRVTAGACPQQARG